MLDSACAVILCGGISHQFSAEASYKTQALQKNNCVDAVMHPEVKGQMSTLQPQTLGRIFRGKVRGKKGIHTQPRHGSGVDRHQHDSAGHPVEFERAILRTAE